MTGQTPRRKPKLVFFQWDHQPNASGSRYLLLHMEQQVKCLATCFDVVVINRDCDYGEICERYEPDLALFESGYRSHGSRPIRITNTSACRDVPKLGLHNGDPWCDRRAGFISDMEHWGIDTFFSIGTRAPDYMPELAESLFVWPNFIDPGIVRDYGQHKVIPVTLTGQVYGLYPWRQKVFPILQESWPCLVSPHHAYESKLTSQLLWGEAYARVLNASFIVPTCGTAAGEVVRKHFEIPGAAACLVTQRTAALEAAGFEDGRNCVFADHHDVADRVQYLFAHPDELQRITAAGHDLVQSRHTLNHRPQIYQWYTLNQTLRPDEKIVQPGPFHDLVKVAQAKTHRGYRVGDPPPDRALMKQGDAHLARDEVEEAKRCYASCLDIVSYLPEARLKLAICALRDGRAAQAYDLLVDLIKVTMLDYGAADPDPMEWAYFLLAMVCDGRLQQADRLRRQYPHLSHRELRRVHQAIERLCRADEAPKADFFGGSRRTIHQTTANGDEEWFAWLAGTLDRCGQPELAAALGAALSAEADPGHRKASKIIGQPSGWRARAYMGLNALLAASGLRRLRPNVPPLPEFGYLQHLARRLLPRAQVRQIRMIRDAFFEMAAHIRR